MDKDFSLYNFPINLSETRIDSSSYDISSSNSSKTHRQFHENSENIVKLDFKSYLNFHYDDKDPSSTVLYCSGQKSFGAKNSLISSPILPWNQGFSHFNCFDSSKQEN
jgi:hypothetical protein